jgi:glycosyltransferase involved in cell wall biosynthesis
MSDSTPRPRVSILLPARDAVATLNACLASIRRQTESRWECVLVDDGSTDGTLELARRAAAADPRIRVVARPHGGLVAALNAGLEACRAELVARMDADDLMHRRRLAEQLALLRDEPGLDAVGCHVRLFPRALLGPGLREYEAWINTVDDPDAIRREAFVECPLAHPTLMIRRDLLTRLRYRDRGWPEDYDLLLRLLLDGRGLGVLPRRRLLWRHGAGRLSLHSAAYADESFTRCKAAFLAGGFLAREPLYLLWGYGATGRAIAGELERHGKRPSHIVELHPGRIGNRIRGAEVIAPDRLASVPRLPLLVSVAGSKPRQKIRRFLDRAGFAETRDFICVA